MNIPLLPKVILTAMLAVPVICHAQQLATTSKNVHVRAGPARDYPVVAVLPPDATVTIEGCLSNYTWCEVLFDDATHGWVYAGNLMEDWNGNNVAILNYGNAISPEILTFSIGAYWGAYYQDRPWYRDRQTWIDRHERPHAPVSPSARFPATPGPAPHHEEHPLVAPSSTMQHALDQGRHNMDNLHPQERSSNTAPRGKTSAQDRGHR